MPFYCIARTMTLHEVRRQIEYLTYFVYLCSEIYVAVLKDNNLIQ